MQCNLIPLIDSNASSFFFEFLKNIIEITNIFEYQFALNDKKVFDLLKLLHGYIDENQIYLALWRELGIDKRAYHGNKWQTCTYSVESHHQRTRSSNSLTDVHGLCQR